MHITFLLELCSCNILYFNQTTIISCILIHLNNRSLRIILNFFSFLLFFFFLPLLFLLGSGSSSSIRNISDSCCSTNSVSYSTIKMLVFALIVLVISLCLHFYTSLNGLLPLEFMRMFCS